MVSSPSVHILLSGCLVTFPALFRLHTTVSGGVDAQFWTVGSFGSDRFLWLSLVVLLPALVYFVPFQE